MTTETPAPSHPSIIVYDRDKLSVSLLTYVCRQHGIKCIAAADEKELEALLNLQTLPLFICSALAKREHFNLSPLVLLLRPEDEEQLDVPPLKPPIILTKPLAAPEATYVLLQLVFPECLDLQHYPAQLAGFTVMLKAVRKIIAAKLRSPAFSLTLAQAAEQYCTTHCLHGEHFQEIAPQDRDKYRLLSAKVLVGQRVCEKRDGCRLLSFAQHLSDSGSELAHTPLRDIFAPVAAAGWLSAFDSQLDNSSRFIALIKEAVMTYCVKYCTHSKKGIEFTEGDVFLSEWTDLMKNSCDYCPERNCPVSDFMRIFISRIVGIERSAP